MTAADPVDAVGVVVGVDVGGTTTRAVAFDGDLAVVAGQRTPTPRGSAAIADAVAGLVAAVAQDPALVAVGLPGRVDPVAGTVAAAVNLGLAGPAPIAAMIGARTGARVHVENDVNSAALGAFTHFDLEQGSSLAYINVGTGIAAGFVLAGRLLRGATGAAGEVGHIPMWPDGPACPCGQRGCAEAIGSGRAAGADGSRRAQVAEAVAWTVQLAVMTLDVDVVAIGGGMSERSGFLDDVVAVLARREAAAPMLAASGLVRRVRLAPADVPLGSLGVVLAARSSRP
jgi:glucokinase